MAQWFTAHNRSADRPRMRPNPAPDHPHVPLRRHLHHQCAIFTIDRAHRAFLRPRVHYRQKNRLPRAAPAHQDIAVFSRWIEGDAAAHDLRIPLVGQVKGDMTPGKCPLQTRRWRSCGGRPGDMLISVSRQFDRPPVPKPLLLLPLTAHPKNPIELSLLRAFDDKDIDIVATAPSPRKSRRISVKSQPAQLNTERERERERENKHRAGAQTLFTV